jgi:hypothetical protein
MPNLSGYVLSLIQEHIGFLNAIPAETLAVKASAFYNVSISGREIRQVVHNLRQAENPICSGAAGFYWPVALQDIFICTDYEFRSQARSMLLTARKLRQAGNRLFGGQGRLI